MHACIAQKMNLTADFYKLSFYAIVFLEQNIERNKDFIAFSISK